MLWWLAGDGGGDAVATEFREGFAAGRFARGGGRRGRSVCPGFAGVRQGISPGVGEGGVAFVCEPVGEQVLCFAVAAEGGLFEPVAGFVVVAGAVVVEMCQGEARGVVALAGGGGQPGAGVARALDGERQRHGVVVYFRFGQGGKGADKGEVLPVPVVALLLFPAHGAHGVVGQVAVLFAEGLGEAGGVAVALFGSAGSGFF